MRDDLPTADEIRIRFREAFAGYAAADARLRVLRAQLPTITDSAAIHGINHQFELAAAAERDYRAVRREYINHLLN